MLRDKLKYDFGGGVAFGYVGFFLSVGFFVCGVFFCLWGGFVCGVFFVWAFLMGTPTYFFLVALRYHHKTACISNTGT